MDEEKKQFVNKLIKLLKKINKFKISQKNNNKHETINKALKQAMKLSHNLDTRNKALKQAMEYSFNFDSINKSIVESANINMLFKNNSISSVLNKMNFNDILRYQSSLKDTLQKINSIKAQKSLFNHLKNLPSNYKMIDNNDSFLSKPKGITIKNTENQNEISESDVINSLLITDLFENITEKEVLEFYSHLSSYPMLGLKHPVGKKIFKAINEGKSNYDYPNDKTLFRARSKESRPLAYEEMFDPPYNIPSQGRFNFHGINVLYASTQFDCAIKEIDSNPNDHITVIELKLAKKINILNIAYKESPLFNFCTYPSEDNDNKINLSYIIPNFLAQCCQISDIQGIRYKSNKC